MFGIGDSNIREDSFAFQIMTFKVNKTLYLTVINLNALTFTTGGHSKDGDILSTICFSVNYELIIIPN